MTTAHWIGSWPIWRMRRPGNERFHYPGLHAMPAVKPNYGFERLKHELQSVSAKPSRQWAYDILAGEATGVHPKTGRPLTHIQIVLARQAVGGPAEPMREPGEDE